MATSTTLRAPVWLFDLDNTLHDASYAIFPAISANMNIYIARVLGENGMPANQAAVDNPQLVNDDPYGEGWLFKVEVTEPSTMLSAEEYRALIAG